MKCETHLLKVDSKAARSLGVVGRTGNLFDCKHVLNSCVNACVLFNFECCASVWISSAESHLGLWVVLFSLRKGSVRTSCCLVHRRKVSASWLFYKIYHRVDHPMNEPLNRFVAACNTRASTALGELALVFYQFLAAELIKSVGHFCLLFFVCGWNLLPLGVLGSDTLSCFKSAMNLCLLRV